MPPALWGDKNYVLALCLLPFPVPESRAQLYPGTKEDLMGIITGGRQVGPGGPWAMLDFSWGTQSSL